MATKFLKLEKSFLYPHRDCETGEIIFTQSGTKPINRVRYDEETGEPQPDNRNCTFPYETDRDTGEPDCNKVIIHFPKTKFNVPKEYLSVKEEAPPRCKLRDSMETFTLFDSKRVIHLKEEIILGCNKTSHRMFLIPSLFLFFKCTAIFLVISEIFLHIWAHKKNSKNTNANVYYRSPLHILTSQFCAVCRYQSEYDHINRLQDRTKKIHDNLTRVTKSFS